jgi:Uma2 family endonuclease
MVAVRERRERTRVWTAADLLAMPHNLDHRYELVEGRLVTMAPTGGTHGRRTFDLAAALGAYAMQHDLGVVLGAETGFNLTRPGESRETVLAPDVAFVRADNAPLTETDDFPRLAPDLVGEVASPGDSRRRMAAKARRWLDRGVRLVWVVWPRRREIDVWRPGEAELHTLTAADRLDGDTVVPGFSIPVARVCPERPRRRKQPGQYKGEQ